VAIADKDEIARSLRHRKPVRIFDDLEKMNKSWKAGYRGKRNITTFRRKIVEGKRSAFTGTHEN